MKHAPLVTFVLALGIAFAWPISQAVGAAATAAEPPVCRDMTTARMLENPALAEEWAQALRSAEPTEIARMRALFAEIRAAHGCGSAPASHSPRHEGAVLPPGHPPVGDGALPPGHPPIPSSPRAPLFEAPAVLTI
jgi:hypothetical protein